MEVDGMAPHIKQAVNSTSIIVAGSPSLNIRHMLHVESTRNLRIAATRKKTDSDAPESGPPCRRGPLAVSCQEVVERYPTFVQSDEEKALV